MHFERWEIDRSSITKVRKCLLHSTDSVFQLNIFVILSGKLLDRNTSTILRYPSTERKIFQFDSFILFFYLDILFVDDGNFHPQFPIFFK